MADHELPDADRARDRGGSHEDGSVDSSASGDAARGACPTEKLQRTRDVQYERSPFAVWMGMPLNLLASALATAGLGVSAAVYPLYAVTPTPVLAFLGKSAFNLGYLIYMSPIGRWLHLRAVKSHHRTNQPPHSRGVRPSPLTTCSVLPVPFLADNYAYVLVDHATRECAAIDPADPYGVKDLCDRLELNLTAILTTHKHHDHAGGSTSCRRRAAGPWRCTATRSTTARGSRDACRLATSCASARRAWGSCTCPATPRGTSCTPCSGTVTARTVTVARPCRPRARPSTSARATRTRGTTRRRRRRLRRAPRRGALHRRRRHQRRRRRVLPRRPARLLR